MKARGKESDIYLQRFPPYDKKNISTLNKHVHLALCVWFLKRCFGVKFLKAASSLSSIQGGKTQLCWRIILLLQLWRIKVDSQHGLLMGTLLHSFSSCYMRLHKFKSTFTFLFVWQRGGYVEFTSLNSYLEILTVCWFPYRFSCFLNKYLRSFIVKDRNSVETLSVPNHGKNMAQQSQSTTSLSFLNWVKLLS